MSGDSPEYERDDLIGSDLSEDAQNVLHIWHENLVLLDPRYHDKRLMRAAARSMTDQEFRDALIRKSKMPEEDYSRESPDAIDVWFFSNTPRSLHVVLPPPEAEIATRPTALRDALRSRTSADFSAGFFADDWNISDPGNDPPIILTPHPDGTDPNEYHWMGPAGVPSP